MKKVLEIIFKIFCAILIIGAVYGALWLMMYFIDNSEGYGVCILSIFLMIIGMIVMIVSGIRAGKTKCKKQKIMMLYIKLKKIVVVLQYLK